MDGHILVSCSWAFPSRKRKSCTLRRKLSSQLAHSFQGQVCPSLSSRTTVILILAATQPSLVSALGAMLAKDGFMPRQLTYRGGLYILMALYPWDDGYHPYYYPGKRPV
jgi:hypothetical protein